jgi:hypothetical protein
MRPVPKRSTPRFPPGRAEKRDGLTPRVEQVDGRQRRRMHVQAHDRGSPLTGRLSKAEERGFYQATACGNGPMQFTSPGLTRHDRTARAEALPGDDGEAHRLRNCRRC